MRKLIFILLLFPISLFAQNLVPNPSFEDTLWCPYNTGQINAAHHWFSPMNSSGGSSELFHECNNPPSSTGIVGVPSNPFGYHYARTGNTYAGFIFYTYTTSLETRENIEIQLINGINPTRTYYTEFYVSLSNKSAYAISNIGAYFSKNKISGLGHSPSIMNLTPHIEYSGTPITDTMNWVKVSGYFKVQEDGVQYMTIGNFADSGQTIFQQIQNGLTSYYYVDDVYVADSVSYINSLKELDPDSYRDKKIKIYPNPANEILTIEINNLQALQELDFQVLNSVGKQIIKGTINSKKYILDVSAYPKGIYFLVVKNKNAYVFRDKFVVLR